MDGLLRSHQADTTARRLQLERALSQRQAELRARTQEVEELSARWSEDKKVCVCVCECEGIVSQPSRPLASFLWPIFAVASFSPSCVLNKIDCHRLCIPPA